MRRREPFLPQSAAVLFFFALVLPNGFAEEKIDFEKQVLPVLESACFKCHSSSAKKVKGDLRLDDLGAIRAKSRSDNLLFPRKPEKSLLYALISRPAGDEEAMPPPDEGKPLAAEQIGIIRKWIEQGADFGAWKSAAPRKERSVVAVSIANPADVTATARQIDELIETHLARAERKPNPPLADDLWCRRAYLDLVGRIPTYEEINAFLISKDALKRAKLIDTLLASNGHVSTMFNYWCDVLRARDVLADNARGDFYLNYVKASIRGNKPYDQWVREMISAQGSLWQAPAVGYHLRDLGNRFASVDNTAMIFLGTQVGCAQCHDHPYDQWSRKDYHQFAAWTAAIEARRTEANQLGRLSEGDLTSAKLELEKISQRRTSSQRRQLENNLALQLFDGMMGKLMRERPIDYSVRSGSNAAAHLPSDYQYPDGKPNEPITPAVLFGRATLKPGQRPADAFADWLTAPENPRFALNIANRMWARILGAPFSGAIDDIREPAECENPELADFLTRLMVATKFDLRHFQRIVANTRIYARQAGALNEAGKSYHFPGPLLRRMSAEQAWDSLMTLGVPALDMKIRFDAPDTSDLKERAPLNDVEKLIATVRAQAKEQAASQLKAMRRHAPPAKQPYAASAEFSPDAMVRASELPQPAPEGHFLRVFGQSNREVADGSWRSGTVPQTLMMLNSSLFDAVLHPGTPLYNALKRDSGDSGRLRAVYLAILGRVPTMDETRTISSTLHGTGNVEAIAHTLLGTRQFLFVQ